MIRREGTLANTLGIINPFRYRGYVYDEETGLYYLRSRYYNSTISRFISADRSIYSGKCLLSNNVYAYCGNNPANRKDSSGQYWTEDIGPLPYKSAEEAAIAFSEETYSACLYIRHEYAAIIYSRTIDGITTYGYTTPVSGGPHNVSISISDDNTPFATTIVAVAHTQPNEDDFSGKGQENDTISDIQTANEYGLDIYVVGPSLELHTYSYSSGSELDVIRKITPVPLTKEEKKNLVSQFKQSWYDHLEYCPFCKEIIWPTP